LGEDKNTVQGAVFDHKTETPGLGAEITEASFYNQFLGKKLADAKGFVSIHVVKPGSEELGNHSVNGITGGTLTSVGVDEMLGRILGVYYRYFEANKTTMPVASEEMEQEPLNTAEYGA
jgi:Na+-transporting NADH:ubiquinone oxidoreductase subunit C